jgi:hypothetical protein
MHDLMTPHHARRLAAAVVMLAMLTAAGAAAANGATGRGAAAGLAFVPDVGRVAGGARFVAHTADGAVLVAADGILLAPRDAAAPALRVAFAGSDPGVEVAGVATLPGRVNFLVGGDPAHWRRDVPTYAGVAWRGLWRGVDLELAGAGGALKATYTVAPGADPGAIRWRYDGAASVAVTPAGDLAIRVGARTVSDAAPVAWQETAGGRRGVTVAYALAGDGTASFATGPFDPELPLVIDPHLVYATLIGGADVDEGRDIAVDAAGNVFITGATRSAAMPGAGPPQPAYAGPVAGASFGDAFVAKLNAAGDTLLFMTYLGGNGDDVADAIAVDQDGAVYVTGMTRSADFPVVNALQAAPGGQACAAPPCSDAFVAKLNAAGNGLVFSTYLGGAHNEDGGLLDLGARTAALGIALDGARNVVVTGVTESDGFPTPKGAFTARAGGADAFVAKLRWDGQALLYGTLLGGAAAEYSGDVACDALGACIVTGSTSSSAFPTKNAVQPALAGATDAFVAKLDTTASGAASLLWSTYYGGDGADYALALALDAAGNPTIAGHTLSLDLPVPGGYQTANRSAGSATPRDAFLATLAASGAALRYGTYFGGSDADLAYAVDAAAGGQVFVAGRTYSADLPARSAWQSALGGASDILVAAFDPTKTGSASLLSSTYLGGAAGDVAYGLAAGAQGEAYVVGATSGASGDSFPIHRTLGPNGASTGVLVAKLDPRLQYWVPVASRAAGAKGSQWRTDLGVHNGGGDTASLSLRLVAGTASYTDTATVAAGGVGVLTDVVGRLKFTGSGAIEVLSTVPVRLTSRTYNLIAADASCYPGGTFGQSYDPVAAEQGLRAGQSAWLPQLAETSAYRTNLAFTNTGRRPASLTVVLYDGAGTFLKSYVLAVAAGGLALDAQPFLRRAGKSNLQRAYARVFVDTGYGVVASASVIDYVTNDPTTITMIPIGFETDAAWIPVASRAAGANKSVWRSDLGLLNPSTLAANVTLRFRTGGKEYANTALVAPMSQSVLTDVIGAIPAAGSGSLEVDATRSLVVTSRTYNLIASAAACFPQGTLGQGYPTAEQTTALAAGETGWLVGLAETAAYRTNISLTNAGAAAATATVTLVGGAGQTLGSYAVSLAPGEMKQENRPFFARGGQTNMPAGAARVQVTAGTGVVALASVIDNTTNDPTTVAAQW